MSTTRPRASRWLAAPALGLAAVLLLAGCGDSSSTAGTTTLPTPVTSTGSSTAPPTTPPTTSPTSPSTSPDTPPDTPSSTSTSASPGDPAGGTTETACDEVRAGIAAFNDNDFDATVEHFVKAVPLATAEEAQKQTKASADLLEAVEYYAELPAGDYLEASVNSLDFEKYKIITLGQCEPDPDGAPTSDPSGDGGGGTNI